MTTYSVSLDLSGRLRAPETCPACGAHPMWPRSDGDRVVLRCGECRRCWDPELGVLSLVDPTACVGCADREECLRLRAVREGRPAGREG